MEVKAVFKIGDRVDQMCVNCKEERGHIVTSVTKQGGSRASVVQCVNQVSRIAPGRRYVLPLRPVPHMIGGERIVKVRY